MATEEIVKTQQVPSYLANVLTLGRSNWTPTGACIRLAYHEEDKLVRENHKRSAFRHLHEIQRACAMLEKIIEQI